MRENLLQIVSVLNGMYGAKKQTSFTRELEEAKVDVKREINLPRFIQEGVMGRLRKWSRVRVFGICK